MPTHTTYISSLFACLAEKFEEGQSFHLHETHFDIIMEAPPMLTVLGSSKNTPIQMCCVADHFLGKKFACLPLLDLWQPTVV